MTFDLLSLFVIEDVYGIDVVKVTKDNFSSRALFYVFVEKEDSSNDNNVWHISLDLLFINVCTNYKI